MTTTDQMSPVEVWFVGLHGKREGPLSFSQLKVLTAEGELKLHSLVWRSGMPDWKPARDVEELASLFASTDTDPLEVATLFPGSVDATPPLPSQSPFASPEEAPAIGRAKNRGLVAALVLMISGTAAGVGYWINQQKKADDGTALTIASVVEPSPTELDRKQQDPSPKPAFEVEKETSTPNNSPTAPPSPEVTEHTTEATPYVEVVPTKEPETQIQTRASSTPELEQEEEIPIMTEVPSTESPTATQPEPQPPTATLETSPTAAPAKEESPKKLIVERPTPKPKKTPRAEPSPEHTSQETPKPVRSSQQQSYENARSQTASLKQQLTTADAGRRDSFKKITLQNVETLLSQADKSASRGDYSGAKTYLENADRALRDTLAKINK